MPEPSRLSPAEGMARARRLRRDSTPEERLLWGKLRRGQFGLKWKRQQPLGFYIADFVCFERSLIVELDGSQHAEDSGRTYDAVRSDYLEGREFSVLRFWNLEVRKNLDGVLQVIQAALEVRNRQVKHSLTPLSQPLPQGERS